MGSDEVGANEELRLSVLRALGGSVLVVALVAAMFWLIGMAGGTGDDLVATDELDAADASADESDPPAEEPEPEPAPDPDDESEAEPEPDDEPASEPAPDDEPEEEPDPDDEPDEEPDPDDEAPVEDIDPADVTVQVLDGLQDGGGAAADVADELESAGYRIVAQSPAILADVTAVLWTAGNEEAARQVAAEIGAEEVRVQPGTLSDSVAVHVVVGADRG